MELITEKIAANAVLAQARLKGRLKRVFVIGETEDGEIYAAGSHGSEAHLEDIKTFQDKLDRGDYS